jgi:hypothetical protein
LQPVSPGVLLLILSYCQCWQVPCNPFLLIPEPVKPVHIRSCVSSISITIYVQISPGVPLLITQTWTSKTSKIFCYLTLHSVTFSILADRMMKKKLIASGSASPECTPFKDLTNILTAPNHAGISS